MKVAYKGETDSGIVVPVGNTQLAVQVIVELMEASARTQVSARDARIAELEKQLPDGMKDCTIIFKQCPHGHGWLTAKNWVGNEHCPKCTLDSANLKIRELLDANDSLDYGSRSELATLRNQLAATQSELTEIAEQNKGLGEDVLVFRNAMTEAQRKLAERESEVARLTTERDCYKEDFERASARLNDALNQCRCPDCGCGDQVEAESSECGCDSPVCARDGSKTLAQHYLDAVAQLADRAQCSGGSSSTPSRSSAAHAAPAQTEQPLSSAPSAVAASSPAGQEWTTLRENDIAAMAVQVEGNVLYLKQPFGSTAYSPFFSGNDINGQAESIRNVIKWALAYAAALAAQKEKP